MNSPLLYRPTANEIAKVVEFAKHRHPALASRIDKAQDIVSCGLHLEATAWEVRQVVHWRIASQSHAGAYIIVNGGCPCQDSRAKCDGGKWCKHAIAVALYQKILRNHLNADIRRREIDLGILPDGTFNAYAKRLGIVHLKRWGNGYTFVDQASAVRYSLWLATQQPVPVAWPLPVAVAA